MKHRTSTGIVLLPVDGVSLGIALIASVLAAAVVFLPSWRLQAEQALLASRRAQAQQWLHAASEELRTAEATLAQVSVEVESNGLRTLPVTALNSRLAELVDLAGQAGMKLDALSPGEKIRTTRTISVQIRMSGTCPVDALQGFLQRLKAQCPDIAVTSLLLDRQKAPDSQEEASATQLGAKFALDLVWHAAADVPISANRHAAP